MTQLPAEPVRRPRFKKTRAAALGFGLGATLALSPLVWAQNPDSSTSNPTTTTPSVAIPQQSFAGALFRLFKMVLSKQHNTQKELAYGRIAVHLQSPADDALCFAIGSVPAED